MLINDKLLNALRNEIAPYEEAYEMSSSTMLRQIEAGMMRRQLHLVYWIERAILLRGIERIIHCEALDPCIPVA